MKNKMAVVFRIICIRHGETAANKETRVQGHLDVPLSKFGEAQSKEAGLSLNAVKFSRAYTSDLMRAKSTCDNIIKENKAPPQHVITDVRIRERNFGSAEGKLFQEALDMAAAAGATWSSFNPPGAETLSEVQQRCVEFFKELCQSVYDRSKHQNYVLNEDSDEDLEALEPAERILLVSHGAALRQLYNHFKKTLGCEGFPKGSDVIPRISPNTGISEFIVKYSPRKYRMKCLRLHDDRHTAKLKCE